MSDWIKLKLVIGLNWNGWLNWVGICSVNVSVIFYSIIEMVKVNDFNVFEYVMKSFEMFS